MLPLAYGGNQIEHVVAMECLLLAVMTCSHRRPARRRAGCSAAPWSRSRASAQRRPAARALPGSTRRKPAGARGLGHMLVISAQEDMYSFHTILTHILKTTFASQMRTLARMFVVDLQRAEWSMVCTQRVHPMCVQCTTRSRCCSTWVFQPCQLGRGQPSAAGGRGSHAPSAASAEPCDCTGWAQSVCCTGCTCGALCMLSDASSAVCKQNIRIQHPGMYIVTEPSSSCRHSAAATRNGSLCCKRTRAAVGRQR